MILRVVRLNNTVCFDAMAKELQSDCRYTLAFFAPPHKTHAMSTARRTSFAAPAEHSEKNDNSSPA